MFAKAVLHQVHKKISPKWKMIVNEVDRFCSWLPVRIVSRFFKIERDKIVFTNFSGNYDCNPKYICEEVLRRNLPYEIVWVVWGSGIHKNDTKTGMYPSQLTLVSRYDYAFYKHLFTAHVIVDNGTSFVSAGYPKKREQKLINTWHGSLGIKRFPKNDSLRNWRYNRTAAWNGRMIDFMISNSTFEDGYYRETFFPKTPIRRLGHPRNDPLFLTDPDAIATIRSRVYARLGLGDDVRICLYAPTFRDDNDIRPYALRYERILAALADRFGGKWVVLTRFHHRSKKATCGLRFPEGVVSATDYPDLVDIMVCTDVAITDYSSWICEYIHTRRPGFLYATDASSYADSRGFYDPLDKMPFPLATNEDGLVDRIRSFNETKYRSDCEEFLKMKGCMDDGHAAARVVDLIEKIMKGV